MTNEHILVKVCKHVLDHIASPDNGLLPNLICTPCGKQLANHITPKDLTLICGGCLIREASPIKRITVENIMPEIQYHLHNVISPKIETSNKTVMDIIFFSTVAEMFGIRSVKYQVIPIDDITHDQKDIDVADKIITDMMVDIDLFLGINDHVLSPTNTILVEKTLLKIKDKTQRLTDMDFYFVAEPYFVKLRPMSHKCDCCDKNIELISCEPDDCEHHGILRIKTDKRQVCMNCGLIDHF